MILNTYLINKNEPGTLKVSGSYKNSSWTFNNDGSITHNTGIETEIYLYNLNIKVNKSYKITFEVNSEYSFGVYIKGGYSVSNVIQSKGKHVVYITIKGNNKFSFFASGIVTLSNLKIEEYNIISDPLDFSDKDVFINNSWTISYSLDTATWVSFHSYIPDFYITNLDSLYSLNLDQLSDEFTIRDENNDFISSNNEKILIYNLFTYGR